MGCAERKKKKGVGWGLIGEELLLSVSKTIIAASPLTRAPPLFQILALSRVFNGKGHKAEGPVGGLTLDVTTKRNAPEKEKSLMQVCIALKLFQRHALDEFVTSSSCILYSALWKRCNKSIYSVYM